MKIVVATATSRIPPWLEEVIVDYSKKISYWHELEVLNVTSKKLDRDSKDQKLKVESEKLKNSISDSDFVVLCDETGKTFTSRTFAHRLETLFQSGKKRLVFIVGGAYGVSDEIKARADLALNLSPMTLNHHVAIAVILEQIYRGLTIIKGIKYHNG